MGRGLVVFPVLAVLACCGLLLGQDGKVPSQQPPAKPGQEQPKPPEDPAPINIVVETWLGDRHGDYIHERISPVSGQMAYRYDYLNEGRLEVATRLEGGETKKFQWSWRLEAKLSQTFDPYYLKAESSRGEAQSSWKLLIKPDDEQRKIEVSMPNGTTILTETSVDELAGVIPSIVLYKLKQHGALAKPGAVEINMLGPGGAAAIPFSLKVGEAITRTYLEKGASVTPVTILTPPPDFPLPIASRCWIDKYGRIVEAEGLGADKFLICKDEAEAKGGSADQGVQSYGRDDPFSKKRAFTAAQGGSGGKETVQSQPEKVLRPSDTAKELQKAQEMVEELERLVKENSNKAGDTYQNFLLQFKALRPILKQAVEVNQLDGYKYRAEQAFHGAEALIQYAKTIQKTAEDHYNALNEKGVEDCREKLRALRERREFYQDQNAFEMDKIIKDVGGLLQAVRARIELRAKVLVLTGTVSKWDVVKDTVAFVVWLPGGRIEIREPVKILHNVTYAVINDELYRVGETVRGQDVVIEKIQPHGVTVSYKKELREVGIKKR